MWVILDPRIALRKWRMLYSHDVSHHGFRVYGAKGCQTFVCCHKLCCHTIVDSGGQACKSVAFDTYCESPLVSCIKESVHSLV
jgi:hypothetical protein